MTDDPGAGTVLVIDDEDFSANLIMSCLRSNGFVIRHALDFHSAMDMIYEEIPDLILLDIMMPDISGYEVCRILRNDTRTIHLPIIMISAKSEMADKIAGFVTKPFACVELIARMKSQLRRSKQEKCFNPLSELPGNLLILDEIKNRVTKPDQKFAVLYVDLDHFKAYNDVYGFLQGDEVIKFLANLLRSVLKDLGNKFDFLGHVGGDDFIIISTPEKIDSICQRIISEFDTQIGSFYTEQDRGQGFVLTVDRRNQEVQYPLISLSVAVVTNEHRKIDSHWHVGQIAAELKRFAKTQPGSIYVRDRRTK